MPQFDITFYFSQIFWLVLCLIALVIAFRNFFIPRMNNRLARRDEYIDKCLRGAEILELEIQELESKIAQIRKNEAEKSSEIIRNAIRASDEIMSNQISAI
ncbi:hypothetical protein EOM81_08665, partial [bacterium]|nr:hypothetical protein [bacterium]